MKTIAMRFSDNYAPSEGTIKLHSDMILKNGFVWYGKYGNPISQKNIDMLLSMNVKKFLLIKSGFNDRYWVYFSDIKKVVEEDKYIPEYYRSEKDKIRCWFKVEKFEKADPKVMSKCFVVSNNSLLSNTSKYSMSPFFIIDYKEEKYE